MEKKWLLMVNEKCTLGRELWVLNGKEMTLGHKWKLTTGRELSPLNRKEMTMGHKWKSTLGRELYAKKWKRNDFGP